MKKNFTKLYYALLLAGLVSCQREALLQPTPSSGVMTITVGMEQTKTTIADSGTEGTKAVVFNAGDNISVFADGTNNKFTTEAGGRRAEFTGNAEDIEGDYYVISPYAKANSISSDNKITISIPQEQKATKGSFDPKAMISVGKFRKGEELSLKNVLVLIKVTVPAGAKYKKIELACTQAGRETPLFNQSISGEILVDASGNMSASSDADKRHTSITLVPAKGESTIGPGDYYIATRPGNYRISIGYVTEDDHFFVRHASHDNTLTRSHIINAGELSSANYTDITAPATLMAGPNFNLAVKKLANSAVSAVTEDDNIITSIVVKPFSFGGIVGNWKDVKGTSSAFPVTARLVGGELTLYTQGSTIALDANCTALFRNMKALKDIDFGSFNSDNVTNMTRAFAQSGFETLNLSSFKGDKVTSLNYTFENCLALTEVNMRSFSAGSLTDMSLAFTGCTALEKLNLESAYTIKVTNFRGVFNACKGMRELKLGNHFTVSAATDCNNMFSDTALNVSLAGGKCDLYCTDEFYEAMNSGTPGRNITKFNSARFNHRGVTDDVSKIHTGLPLVLIETPGGVDIVDKENWMEGAKLTILNPDHSVAYEGGMSVKGRGNNTWLHPKKPYAIKLDAKSEILGMKSHKRWCLLANYVDRTLIRNEVAFEISKKTSLAYTPSGKFVECFVNGVHRGNYYLCEQIKVDKNRVNIAALKAGEVDGGYLMEYDSYFDEVNKFRSARKNLPVQFKDPDEVDGAQFEFMQNYINTMEEALYDDAKFAAREFEQYMDLQSYADFYIITELTQNLDTCNPKSHYMHKDKGGKMTAGPVWDYDYGTFLKNFLLYFGNPPREGYNIMAQGASQGTYYNRLFQDREFKKLVKERWDAMKGDLAGIPDFIDATARTIHASEAINHVMWPIDSRTTGHDETLSFDDAVQTLKDAYQGKYDYLDNYFGQWRF